MGEEFPQDDDLDDHLIPVAPAPEAIATGGASGGVVTFDQNSLAVLSSMNDNLKRMADSMAKLDSVEQSMSLVCMY